VKVDLSDEALEYGLVARQALEAAGGERLVQEAEADPARRSELVEPVLAELGAWDLQPRADGDELQAAAALCRSVGYWAAPYPVAERLARPTDLEVDGLVVVDEAHPESRTAGVGLRWAGVTLEGRRGVVRERAGSAPISRHAAFVEPVDLEPIDDAGAGDLAVALTLPCWTLLGMLDRAIDLTRQHVVDREQFGQPLAAFQSVQFQLTDAEVERSGLDVLARYTVWSALSGQPGATEDALALRLAAIEAAEVVLRVAHQLHGASGFCDETDLSWISRHSQPLRRLPMGASLTQDHLTRRLGRRPLAGLFADVASDPLVLREPSTAS
jgi:3-oxo-4-pregnene-20-carboxyl-CoA dehydrogenase alpha subunit